MELFQEIAGCVLLLIMGLLMFIKPHFVWKIDNFLTVKDGEPTDLYIAVVRFSGFAFIWIAIILAAVFIFF